MKKRYQIFKERGYRSRLLSAPFRNHLDWSESFGGEVVMSPPFAWRQRYNSSDVRFRNRMDASIEPAIVKELLAKFTDFWLLTKWMACRQRSSTPTVHPRGLSGSSRWPRTTWCP